MVTATDEVTPEIEWQLEWAWFHPCFRCRRHLSWALPALKECYGEFTIDPPLSMAMRVILEKQGGGLNLDKVHATSKSRSV